MPVLSFSTATASPFISLSPPLRKVVIIPTYLPVAIYCMMKALSRAKVEAILQNHMYQRYSVYCDNIKSSFSLQRIRHVLPRTWKCEDDVHCLQVRCNSLPGVMKV